jgi:16S rRNA (guanine966-N2)-methyltransferase
MRVIGGEFRSRVLKSVPGEDTRPTPDRMRESLFSILATRIHGAVFADLYAGTGAVGIEAISRGARRAIFVESNRAAVSVIRQNLKSLRAEGQAEIRPVRATSMAGSIAADIVFVDPPYRLEKEYNAVLNIVRAPLVIVQHDRRLTLAEAYGRMQLTRTVRQGDNCLSFYAPGKADAPAASATIEESGA